jgi:Luciferase
VSATTIAGSSSAGRVIALLGAWPGVRTAPADCGVGVGVGVGVGTLAGQILHFHDESYADLRLTRPVVNRMHEALAHSRRIFMVPGDDWIGIRLETAGDIALLVPLVSVAIKANLGVPPPVAIAGVPSCAGAGPRVAVAGLTGEVAGPADSDQSVGASPRNHSMYRAAEVSTTCRASRRNTGCHQPP